MKHIKRLYYCVGIGFLLTLALHMMSYVVPEFSDTGAFVYAFGGLLLAGMGMSVGAIALGMRNEKRRDLQQNITGKAWIFVRYTSPRVGIIILAGFLYGGIHLTLPLVQKHEGKTVLERHNSQLENIHGQELQLYHAYQRQLGFHLSGTLVLLYSVMLLLLGSALYAPIVWLFEAFKDTTPPFPKNLAPLLRTACKNGTLFPLIPALSRSPSSFSNALAVALHEYRDSRAIPRLLAVLEDAESPPRQEILHIFLQHSCRYPRTIVFGQQQDNQYHPRSTLYNPVVTRLTVSMPRLKYLVIDPLTYDFYAVERFLTYAINYLGQAYLKQHVVVHIQGNPGELHTNIKNSLTNLCKEIRYRPR